MDKKKASDHEYILMRKIASRDEDAFRELYDRTHRRIYFYLLRILGEKEAVEDVMVETFSEIWRSAQKFMGRSRPSTWMLGIARNLAMSYLRKIKHDDSIDDHQCHLSSGDSKTEEYHRRDLIDKAFLSLSLKHREILDLVFYQELSYAEIAVLLDIPVDTVKTRVFYAKRELKKILIDIGEFC